MSGTGKKIIISNFQFLISIKFSMKQFLNNKRKLVSAEGYGEAKTPLSIAGLLARGRKLSLNFLVITIIIGMNSLGLSAIGETLCYFNDTETSSANVLTAGTLDFSLTNTDVEEFIGIELGEDVEFVSVATKMTGSMDIQYKAYVEKISGDDDFCNALQMEVLHSQIYYDGDLMSFDTATTTAFGTWAFELKLPHLISSIPHGAECNVDLVFKGWRDDVAEFDQSGFTDEERIHLNLTNRMIVLNEFLPNPEGEAYGFDFGDDSSDMPQGEWVEIYNNSDHDFDLAGWYIKDELVSDTNKIMITNLNTVPSGTIIGAKSWLVVYMNKAVLNNSGDTVKLFDNNDNLVHYYTYSSHDYCELEPTPGDENSDTTGDGSCDSVPPNKTYARIPDGVGSWVDPIPTPGGVNILEEIELPQQSVAEEVNNVLGIAEEGENEDEGVGSETGTSTEPISGETGTTTDPVSGESGTTTDAVSDGTDGTGTTTDPVGGETGTTTDSIMDETGTTTDPVSGETGTSTEPAGEQGTTTDPVIEEPLVDPEIPADPEGETTDDPIGKVDDIIDEWAPTDVLAEEAPLAGDPPDEEATDPSATDEQEEPPAEEFSAEEPAEVQPDTDGVKPEQVTPEQVVEE